MTVTIESHSSNHPQDSPDRSAKLTRARHRNDMQLKSRFEDIFAKYSKDFNEVADIIDLNSGKIVVNKGHVSRMTNEQDIGDEEKPVDFPEECAPDMRGSRLPDELFSDSDKGPRVSGKEEANVWEDQDEVEVATPQLSSTSKAIVGALQASTEDQESQVFTEHQIRHNVVEGFEKPVVTKNVRKAGDAPVHNAAPTPATPQAPSFADLERLGQQVSQNISEFLKIWNSAKQAAVDPAWSAPPLPNLPRLQMYHSTTPTTQRDTRYPLPQHAPFSQSLWTPVIRRRRRRRDGIEKAALEQEKSRNTSISSIQLPRTYMLGNLESRNDSEIEDAYTIENANKDPGANKDAVVKANYDANTKRRLGPGRGRGRKRQSQFSNEDLAKIIHLRNRDGLTFIQIQQQYFPEATVSAVSSRYYKSNMMTQEAEESVMNNPPATLYVPASSSTGSSQKKDAQDGGPKRTMAERVSPKKRKRAASLPTNNGKSLPDGGLPSSGLVIAPESPDPFADDTPLGSCESPVEEKYTPPDDDDLPDDVYDIRDSIESIGIPLPRTPTSRSRLKPKRLGFSSPDKRIPGSRSPDPLSAGKSSRFQGATKFSSGSKDKKRRSLLSERQLYPGSKAAALDSSRKQNRATISRFFQLEYGSGLDDSSEDELAS